MKNYEPLNGEDGMEGTFYFLFEYIDLGMMPLFPVNGVSVIRFFYINLNRRSRLLSLLPF
jgi:hypothetical protein